MKAREESVPDQSMQAREEYNAREVKFSYPEIFLV